VTLRTIVMRLSGICQASVVANFRGKSVDAIPSQETVHGGMLSKKRIDPLLIIFMLIVKNFVKATLSASSGSGPRF